MPQYFVESGDNKVEITISEVPEPLLKASFSNPSVKSKFVYQYPSWWDASPKTSEDLITELNDGSVAIYRRYKFVDQPASQRFELNESEKTNLQAVAVKMQKSWANSAMMDAPSKGTLNKFDSGMMVTPPKGLEFDYVPIVIKQYMASTSITQSPTPKPFITVSSNPVTSSSPIPTPTLSNVPKVSSSPVAKSLQLLALRESQLRK